MKRKTEAQTPPETIQILLDASGQDLVLVGGQSLAFWAAHFGLWRSTPDMPAVSNDVDFLSRSAADKAAVGRLAKAINGHAVFPSNRAMTALVGQAVLDVSEDEYINADVLFKIIGLAGDTVRKRAVKVEQPESESAFLVMHPLDVLQSRLSNLYQLREKQNDKGRTQLALAIEVGRAFLREAANEASAQETETGRSPVQGYVSAIERMATEDAARKVAKRHGLYVADAIDPLVIPPGPFWTKRWPGLRKLMSPEYAESIQVP